VPLFKPSDVTDSFPPCSSTNFESGEEEYERRAEGMPAKQAAAIAVEISADRQKEDNSPPEKSDEPADAAAIN
jgi:hypothetical protein